MSQTNARRRSWTCEIPDIRQLTVLAMQFIIARNLRASLALGIIGVMEIIRRDAKEN